MRPRPRRMSNSRPRRRYHPLNQHNLSSGAKIFSDLTMSGVLRAKRVLRPKSARGKKNENDAAKQSPKRYETGQARLAVIPIPIRVRFKFHFCTPRQRATEKN